jgi:hypothetical protein
MDRRVKATIRAALLAAVAAAGMLLSACSNVNLVALLTTEVMRATNKFLVVQSVDPVNGAANVDPGGRIAIKVDRALDMSSVDSTTVTLSDLTGTDPTVFTFDYTFNDVSKILYLDADPWLGDNSEYVLTITKGVKGTDGSVVENEYVWSFTTGIYPKGSVKIEADKAATNKAFPTKLSLTITCNDVGYYYRVGASEAQCLAAGWDGGPIPASYVDTAIYGFASGTLDGTQSVYIQVRNVGGQASSVKFDTIILDTVKPTITVNAPTIYQNATTAATPAITPADDRSGIDTGTYSWSGAGLSFSATNVQTPTITAGADGSYTASVSVQDLAGNTSTAATMAVVRDTVAPNAAPTVAPTTGNPACTPAPRWSWAKQSTAGGETTPVFAWELRDSVGGVFVSSSSTTGTSNTRPSVKWPDYTRGAMPGVYTMWVWERDLAGNRSASAGTSTVTVTSILPVDGATGIILSPTLQWWTIANPRESSAAPRYYILHFGYLYRGIYRELSATEVAQPEKADPSYLIKGLGLATEYLWYIEVPDFDLRVPAKDYYSFTTVLK